MQFSLAVKITHPVWYCISPLGKVPVKHVGCIGTTSGIYCFEVGMFLTIMGLIYEREKSVAQEITRNQAK